jgi:hypothetical protein
MPSGQLIVMLICAVLGFGIVSNMIGSRRKPDHAEGDEPHDDGSV